METIVYLGKNIDFWVHPLDWPEAHDTGEAIDRLEEMAKDSRVSYPLEAAHSRHGLYDDERLYLVYEQADTDHSCSKPSADSSASDDIAGPDWMWT